MWLIFYRKYNTRAGIINGHNYNHALTIKTGSKGISVTVTCLAKRSLRATLQLVFSSTTVDALCIYWQGTFRAVIT